MARGRAMATLRIEHNERYLLVYVEQDLRRVVRPR